MVNQKGILIYSVITRVDSLVPTAKQKELHLESTCKLMGCSLTGFRFAAVLGQLHVCSAWNTNESEWNERSSEKSRQ